MNFSDLAIFQAVVESGGICRAAKRLHRVPSNVTTRIRQLEEKLDVELFRREGKRLILTETGTVFLDYTKQLLHLAQEAQDALHSQTLRGGFRLGASESVVATRLPVPLDEFHQRHPEVRLELRAATSQKLIRDLQQGTLDAAVIANPTHEAGMETALQYREELVLVTRADHPPVQHPRDLAGCTLLVFETGCAYRQRLEGWYTQHGAVMERLVEFSSYHAILGCVAVGTGAALVPQCVLNVFSERSRLGIHHLPSKWNSVDIVLAWCKGRDGAKLSALKAVLKTWWGTASVSCQIEAGGRATRKRARALGTHDGTSRSLSRRRSRRSSCIAG